MDQIVCLITIQPFSKSKKDSGIQKVYFVNIDLVLKIIIRDHAKCMGYTGLVQMGYGARTFSTYINNGACTFFIKHTYGMGQYCIVDFYELFFTLVLITKTNLCQAAKIN